MGLRYLNFAQVFSLIIFTLFSSQSLALDFPLKPMPSWVKTIDFDDASMTNARRISKENDGIKYIYTDNQTSYIKDKPEFYSEVYLKVLTYQGAQASSHYSFVYLPKYQDYRIHKIDIIRDGKVIDASSNTALRFIKQEAPLGVDEFESLSVATLFIPGIKPGDHLRVSHSLIGQNKAFGSHAFGLIELGNTIQRGLKRHILLMPKGKRLYFSSTKGPLKPKVSSRQSHKEYMWNLEMIKSNNKLRNASFFRLPFPHVYYSDFKSWGGVSNWAIPLFNLPKETHTSVKLKADEITKNLTTKADKVKAILAFMQKDIEYVGMELGRNGHVPFPAETVLQRKYGDCKDQTHLLRQLLYSVGIASEAALVHSQAGWSLKNQLPSPAVFDHVIVKVQMGKNTLWFDPTRVVFDYEPNRIISETRYKYALPLTKKSKKLSSLIAGMPKSPTHERRLDFKIKDETNLARMEMALTDTLNDHMADEYRYGLAKNTEGQFDKTTRKMLKRYLNRGWFEKVDKTTRVEDKERNKVQNNYTYKVNDSWLAQKDGRSKLILTPDTIKKSLPRLRWDRIASYIPSTRTYIKETFTLPLKNWDIKPEKFKVEGKHHSFYKKVAYDGNTLSISYEYKIKSAVIPLKDLKVFSQELYKVYKNLSYHLYTPKKSKLKTTSKISVKDSDQPLITSDIYISSYGFNEKSLSAKAQLIVRRREIENYKALYDNLPEDDFSDFFTDIFDGNIPNGTFNKTRDITLTEGKGKHTYAARYQVLNGYTKRKGLLPSLNVRPSLILEKIEELEQQLENKKRIIQKEPVYIVETVTVYDSYLSIKDSKVSVKGKHLNYRRFIKYKGSRLIVGYYYKIPVGVILQKDFEALKENIAKIKETVDYSIDFK